MGAVVHQSGDRRTSVNYYEALNQHPVGSNRLPRILMAAFARQDSIRVFGDLIIHWCSRFFYELNDDARGHPSFAKIVSVKTAHGDRNPRKKDNRQFARCADSES
jgi:hypothetical protein